MAANSGIAVKILHVFGDKLWGLEPAVCLQVPNLGAIIKPPTMDEFPALGETKKSNAVAIVTPEISQSTISDEAELETDMQNIDISKDNADPIDDQDKPTESEESPDDKLKRAFLVSIKKMGKKPPTPLLTSNFYRNHILEADSTIDIKKTSYKKLSKFLQDMISYDYLTVKEEPKGVEKITAFNITHPDVVSIILNVSDSGGQQSDGGADGLFVTEMRELYTVTNDTMKFFNVFDVKCGEGIEPAQVKKYVKEYVCNKKLQDPSNIRQIHVDEMLREVCQLDDRNKIVPFDVILGTIIDRMDHSYAMRHRNELKTSGKQASIKMTLATRCGNKQVTLIDGMELFGIRLPEFAQACKVGVAASTSIIRPDCPANGNKGQLLVQGNQIRFVHKLLTETYKIPSKFITGLDLAKKEKKKKK